MLAGERFGQLTNVHCLPVTTWKELVAQTEVALKAAKHGDWVIVDRFDKPWDFVQGYFSEEIYGKAADDYIMMRRKQLVDRKTGETQDRPALVGEFGIGDWVTMGKLYTAWFHSLHYVTPAHLYVTTPPKPLDESDDADTKLLFGAFGIRPAGRRGMAHEFHSVFVMNFSRHGSHSENNEEAPGSWHVTTVKDRERPMLVNMELRDFGLQYVKKIARVG